MDSSVSKEIIGTISALKRKINDLFQTKNYYGKEFKNILLQYIIEINEHLSLFNVYIYEVNIKFFYYLENKFS